jgi:tetratricopeptide (TPR) repeat protein
MKWQCPLFLGLIVVLGLLQPVSWAWADDPGEAKKFFDDFYGEPLKAALGTRSPMDDVELAGEMVKAAQSATDQPNLLEMLCTKAHDLGAKHPAGYDAAIEAMRLLRKHVPAKSAEALTNMITLMDKQYRSLKSAAQRKEALEKLLDFLVQSADYFISEGQLDEAKKIYYKAQTMAGASDRTDLKKAIKARFTFLNNYDTVMQRAQRAVATLKTNPKDAKTAEELVMIYVADLNDPTEAAKFLSGVSNPELIRFVPMAGRDGQGASPQELFDLAEWYRNKLANNKRLSHRALLLRSRAYYKRFLADYGKDDIKSTRAKLAIKIIDGQVAKLPQMPTLRRAKPGTSKSAIDLLAKLDLKSHLVKGSWRRIPPGNPAAMLVVFSPAPFDRVTLPIELKGDYHLNVDFVLLDARATIGVILPIAGKASVGLLVNAFDGSASVLTKIGGRKAPDNGSRFAQAKPLSSGKKYTLEVDVSVNKDEVEIIASLNGGENVHWQGPVSALSSWKELGIQHHFAPGLAAWNSKLPVQFHRATVDVKPGQFAFLKAGDLKEPSIPAPATPAIAKAASVDALAAISPEADTVSGSWSKLAGGLSVRRAARSLIEAPVRISGNYSVELNVNKVPEPGGALMVHLPVGKASALVQIGQVSRIWTTSGSRLKPDSVIFSTSLYQLAKYKIIIEVQSDPTPAIKIFLNGKPHLAWDGTLSELARPYAYRPRRNQSLALGALDLAYEVVGLTIKTMSGQGSVQLLRDAPVDPAVDIGRGFDLLKMVDPDEDAEIGDWEIEDGLINITGITYARMAIPVSPTGSYEFQAIVERLAANGPVHFHLPVGTKNAVGVQIGEDGVSLGLVNGEPYSSRTTGTQALSELGFFHVTCGVVIKGEKAQIIVDVNGNNWVNWKGPISDLSVSTNWTQKESHAMGLGVHEASMVIHGLRLWLASGTLKRTREPSVAPEPDKPAGSPAPITNRGLKGRTEVRPSGKRPFKKQGRAPDARKR